MTALDRLIPAPAMVEIDHVVLAAQPAQVWERIRHADLAESPLIRALFAIRTLRVLPALRWRTSCSFASCVRRSWPCRC